MLEEEAAPLIRYMVHKVILMQDLAVEFEVDLNQLMKVNIIIIITVLPLPYLKRQMLIWLGNLDLQLQSLQMVNLELLENSLKEQMEKILRLMLSLGEEVDGMEDLAVVEEVMEAVVLVMFTLQKLLHYTLLAVY